PAISSSISVPGTFLWKVDDGTIVSGTDTSVTMTATFPAGFRYVHLTAVAGNGHSHHCPIRAFVRRLPLCASARRRRQRHLTRLPYSRLCPRPCQRPDAQASNHAPPDWP